MGWQENVFDFETCVMPFKSFFKIFQVMIAFMFTLSCFGLKKKIVQKSCPEEDENSSRNLAAPLSLGGNVP